MEAFLTGSRAYGTPREDSDIDLVVLMSPADSRTLCDHVQGDDMAERGEYDSGGHSFALRFGNLNLIVTTGWRHYACWRAGTEELVKRRPVTREEAVTHFTQRRKEFSQGNTEASAVAEEAGVETELCGTEDALGYP